MSLCNTSAENVGWQELFDGNMIKASFCMYDVALIGWTVGILFFVFQFMLYLKTRNLNLTWITGIFFVSLYGVSAFVTASSLMAIFVVLVFELAGILFMLVFK